MGVISNLSRSTAAFTAGGWIVNNPKSDKALGLNGRHPTLDRVDWSPACDDASATFQRLPSLSSAPQKRKQRLAECPQAEGLNRDLDHSGPRSDGGLHALCEYQQTLRRKGAQRLGHSQYGANFCTQPDANVVVESTDVVSPRGGRGQTTR